MSPKQDERIGYGKASAGGSDKSRSYGQHQDFSYVVHCSASSCESDAFTRYPRAFFPKK